ncbi:hypothetical protein PBY51_005819 [Eleginops maclovinus]|uniref:Uncharacterized protein n=1 Tax=Eleginops maclovinus TaxID=56733 RepID=A0AAN8AAM2_ELEMC|nr:hypothetical protein PBY51_005819 [Eleginops maclovinus]
MNSQRAHHNAVTSPRAPFKLPFPRQALKRCTKTLLSPGLTPKPLRSARGGAASWFWRLRSPVQSQQWSDSKTLTFF